MSPQLKVPQIRTHRMACNIKRCWFIFRNSLNFLIGNSTPKFTFQDNAWSTTMSHWIITSVCGLNLVKEKREKQLTKNTKKQLCQSHVVIQQLWKSSNHWNLGVNSVVPYCYSDILWLGMWHLADNSMGKNIKI